MKNTKVKKIVIELSGKDVELTISQAQELRAALNELFEEKVTIVKEKEYLPSPYPVPYPQPYPVYPRPWRYIRPITPYTEPWVTWCSSGNLYRSSAGTNVELEGSSLRFQLTS